MADGSARLVRVAAWRRLDVDGLERCVLWRAADGWRLSGVLVLARPCLDLRYEVRCDAAWRTRAVSVVQRSADGEGLLELLVDEQQRWWSAGSELVAVRGSLDVDLQLTPATNTLALRRLDLAAGAAAEVQAAWVLFPELEVRRHPQRYLRLGEQSYRFESPGFAAELQVDDLGLVTRYGELWERVAIEPA
jgi:hypothetical protein